MARQIDVDKLDKDDVAYLRQRPWLIAEAEQVHGVEDMEERMAEVEQKAAKKEQALIKSGKYEELNIREIRTLASDRHLDRSGSKKELIQRLQEEDERQAALEKLPEDDGVVDSSEPEPLPEGAVSVNENPNDRALDGNPTR